MPYPPFHPESGRAPDELTLAEFGREFVRGETGHVEFKTGAGADALQDAIVAFSNSDGGVILIGVKDGGEVVGRDLDQGTLDRIHEALRSVHDPGRFSLHEVAVGGLPVVVIAIARRIDGFAQTSRGRVLVRRGTHKVALFGSELRKLVIERSLERFEEHDAGLRLDEAAPDRLRAVAGLYGWDRAAPDFRDRLREHGLLLPHDNGLTIAGAAYLTSDPAETLGKSYIEILRFPTTDGEYDRRLEIRGPLDLQVRHATDEITAQLGHQLVVLGLKRHEIPRLPAVVLREAIANAVAHRSYETSGTAIRIELRPDEVVVTSPGGLPEPVTEDNIRIAQSARNLNIIRVLRRAGLAEDAGRGIDVMQDSMRSELLEPPVFKDLDFAVEVSLPVRSAVSVDERAWIREVQSRGLIEPADRMILVHAARGEVLTNARVRDLLGLDSRDARRALRRLTEAGLLSQEGQRGGAIYSLGESLSAPAGLRLTQAQLEAVVLELAQEAPVTNARLRSRTGLDRARALRLLDGLVAARRLVREGERRGTRYVLPDHASPAA